jgi:hypothetical protein
MNGHVEFIHNLHDTDLRARLCATPAQDEGDIKAITILKITAKRIDWIEDQSEKYEGNKSLKHLPSLKN